MGFHSSFPAGRICQSFGLLLQRAILRVSLWEIKLVVGLRILPEEEARVD